jgi:hypothetical protein
MKTKKREVQRGGETLNVHHFLFSISTCTLFKHPSSKDLDTDTKDITQDVAGLQKKWLRTEQIAETLPVQYFNPS